MSERKSHQLVAVCQVVVWYRTNLSNVWFYIVQFSHYFNIHLRVHSHPNPISGSELFYVLYAHIHRPNDTHTHTHGLLRVSQCWAALCRYTRTHTHKRTHAYTHTACDNQLTPNNAQLHFGIPYGIQASAYNVCMRVCTITLSHLCHNEPHITYYNGPTSICLCVCVCVINRSCMRACTSSLSLSCDAQLNEHDSCVCCMCVTYVAKCWKSLAQSDMDDKRA